MSEFPVLLPMNHDDKPDALRTTFVQATSTLIAPCCRGSMPAMLTRDERVIRQDCLCYRMEHLRYPAA